MKQTLLIISIAFISVLVASSFFANAFAPFDGKLIALDAGHGGAEKGAVNTFTGVMEKDVNLAVVYALKEKFKDSGAQIVLTRAGDETLDSRKSRVDYALEQCKFLAGRKCDILVSVHHNGSSSTTHDGTMVIYNERADKPLAIALHDALKTSLGLPDEGYDNGGYGITVYGHLVSALTEAYYITNNWEANQYLAGTPFVTPNGYTVLTGSRVDQEAQALYQGISNYFSFNSGGGRGKPNK